MRARAGMVLVLGFPLLSGCLVPDAPFQGPRPEASAGAPTAPPMAPASPVYTVPHSAPPLAGEVLAPLPSSERLGSSSDTCGADALRPLVGKPRTEIPIPADLTHRRVVCTTCPVTPEVDPARQTITYDSATNLVTKVSCG